MKALRPHRFPPLSQLTAQLPGITPGSEQGQYRDAVADGFQQGLDKGYQEGHESGLNQGRAAGHEQGHQEGLEAGREEGRREVLAAFEGLAAPLEAVLAQVHQLQDDYHSALRKEVVDLVAKVARQVIRCELALQPTQLLSLVDETLAVMPPSPEGIEIYLHPEECQRIRELAPERVSEWTLIPDARLEHGECRVKAGDREADAGCHQRLNACMDQVRAQLIDGEAPPAPPAEAENMPAPRLKAVKQPKAASALVNKQNAKSAVKPTRPVKRAAKPAHAELSEASAS